MQVYNLDRAENHGSLSRPLLRPTVHRPEFYLHQCTHVDDKSQHAAARFPSDTYYTALPDRGYVNSQAGVSQATTKMPKHDAKM